MPNNDSTQTFEIDLNIQLLSNAVQEALKQIGSCTGYSVVTNKQIVIKGKTKYGLQSIKLIIQLDKTDDANTKLSIDGDGDDVWGTGSRKAIERFMNELNSLVSTSNNTDEVQKVEYEATSSFEKKTGFTKGKLVLVVLGFLLLLGIIKSGIGDNEPSIDTASSTIERYLKKNYLRDPSSYEYIGNFGFSKRSDGNFQVFHQFRANNGFGGKESASLFFVLSNNCRKVISVKN